MEKLEEASNTLFILPNTAAEDRVQGTSNKETGEESRVISQLEDKCDVKFSPPLYCQRYEAVRNVIQDYHNGGTRLINLLDVGCAECKFVKRAIQIPFLERIAGLDVDRDLVASASVQHSLTPLTTDYLHKRKKDLKVEVFHGSIADRDQMMLGIDVVTAIEVIEHLYPSVLSQFEETVFSYLRPKVVVVTTPNSEFNVLFPNFSGMRHPDHKFEWTRAEFRVWSERLSRTYGYSVTYSGVGDPPPNSADVGPCSQIAVFVKDPLSPTPNLGCGDSAHPVVYEKVFSTIYPGHNQTEDEIINNEIIYAVNSQSYYLITNFEVEDKSRTHLSVSHIWQCSRHLSSKLAVQEFRERLKKLNYELTDDGNSVIINMEEPDTSSGSDYDEILSPAEHVDPSQLEEFWDC